MTKKQKADGDSSVIRHRALMETLIAEPDLDDDAFEEKIGAEVQEAVRELEGSSTTFEGPGGKAWKAATDIVQDVRPVPWIFWVIIRSVYGRSGPPNSPDAMTFSLTQNLLIHAANESSLNPQRQPGELPITSLAKAVGVLGGDVSATLCFMHAVCRRIGTNLSERIWKAIVDDALLRAHIGYHVGVLSPAVGGGRGMLAGFAGRCGLAIQIASGTQEQAQKALSGLASGVEIGQVCIEVYGCDPLQVAALALIAGGCNRDIALGISSYSLPTEESFPGSEQFLWMSLFSVIENLRMGRKDSIPEIHWKELEYTPLMQEELAKRIQAVQRKGHGWRWISQQLSELNVRESVTPSGP